MTDRDLAIDEFLLIWMRRGRDHDRHNHGGGGDGGGGGGTQGGGTGGGYIGPTATPFLLIPSGADDVGARPITVGPAVANVNVTAAVNKIIESPSSAQYYIQLGCVVTNLGVTSCGAGVAEFYVGGLFSIWNTGHESLTAAQVKADAQLIGVSTFRAPPGGSTTVACSNLWTPVVPHHNTAGVLSPAQKGVLVRIYDPITDPLTAAFDAVSDRHVARNDQVMDPILF